ncbi:MAG: protein kinase [Planctomycetaceae bacterium]|nr:protein kinase [Planctomycetaceae bacterium]
MQSDERDRLERILRHQWDDRLGDYAEKEAFIDHTQLHEALEERERTANLTLSQIFVDRGWLSKEEVEVLLDRLKAADFSVPDPGRRDPPEVLEIGEDLSRVLAEFVLVSRLGSGGAAEVWKSWDRLLGRWVAVKVPRFLPESQTAASRFKREAQAAARLTHPNIIPIHRVAEEKGRPYIVMQLIEGKTLLDERPAPDQAPRIIRDVARAVHYAHSQGVIHRDIKPGNLLLDGEGRPWIFDFGLVFLPDEARQLTLPGAVIGTPSYMSPEQAAGGDQAHSVSTDIYSLGATLYDLVTGQPPFTGSSVADIVAKVKLEEPARPRSLIPKLDPALEGILQKAMEKNPARRYATAEELAEDLDRFLSGTTVRARPLPFWERGIRRLARHGTAIGWTVLGLLLAAALGIWAGRKTSPPSETQAPPPVAAPATPKRDPVVLLPKDAVLRGETMTAYPDGESTIIAGWNSSRCSAEWFVSAPGAGWYKVELTYSADVNNGGKYILSTEKEEWTGNLANTGSWSRYQTVSLGTIRLPAEKSRLRLAAAEVTGGLCNFRSLRLIPQP